MKKTIDLTYSNKLKVFIFGIIPKDIDVLYTIEGKTGKTTTTSLILDDKNMVTFDFQQLKVIVESTH